MSKTRISFTALRKQALGAAVGTLVALGMYGVYTVASPVVTGWLVRPSATAEASVSKFSDADRKAKQNEIAEIARGILEREGGMRR